MKNDKDLSLYNMFLTMIRNNYNKQDIKGLQTIKDTLDMIPMYMIMNNCIHITQVEYLKDLIDTNISMLYGG